MSENAFMAALAAVSLTVGLAARLAAWSCQWLQDSLLSWCLAMVSVPDGICLINTRRTKHQLVS
jgi:hypothetical protein